MYHVFVSGAEIFDIFSKQNQQRISTERRKKIINYQMLVLCHRRHDRLGCINCIGKHQVKSIDGGYGQSCMSDSKID